MGIEGRTGPLPDEPVLTKLLRDDLAQRHLAAAIERRSVAVKIGFVKAVDGANPTAAAVVAAARADRAWPRDGPSRDSRQSCRHHTRRKCRIRGDRSRGLASRRTT